MGKIMNTGEKRVRDFEALEKRRRKGMALLSKGFTQAEVARVLGVSRMTVMRWGRLQREKGRLAWKGRRLGRPPKSLQTHPKLFAPADKLDALSCAPFFKNMESLYYVVKVVERESGVLISPVQLVQLLKENTSPGQTESRSESLEERKHEITC